jgi:hypothetical protein
MTTLARRTKVLEAQTLPLKFEQEARELPPHMQEFVLVLEKLEVQFENLSLV